MKPARILLYRETSTGGLARIYGGLGCAWEGGAGMNVTELSGTALGGLVFLPACVEADTPLLVYLHGQANGEHAPTICAVTAFRA